MAFDYTALAVETVQPLIEEFGMDGELSTPSGAPSEPYASKLGAAVLADVKIVQTAFKKMDNMGTLVEKGDVLFLVSTAGVTVDPELADRIIVDSISYQVVRVDPLKPGPVIMLWKVHARK